MDLFWPTLIIIVSAVSGISTVIRAIRIQEKELPLFDPHDVAQ
jgi:hypothetical protein